MPEIARQWFIPGEGIDRHVISADIQRYLGNDATVRPGQGTGDNQGIAGYWIKAYRNLTSAMIADLRADSRRWVQEQRSTGTRGPYEGSSTYHQSSAGRVQRRDADSPSLENAYQNMPRDRVPAERRPQPVDAMQIDPPAPQTDRRYGHTGHPGRGGYPQENRDARDARDPRYAPQQDRNYPQDAMMSDTYGRPPVTTSYAPDSRYAPSYPHQANDAGMPGFGRQPPPPGNYYPVPVSSSYDAIPAMPGRPQDPSQYPGQQYGQPQPPNRQDPYREPRDARPDPRDPRFAGRGYDPSDAYPSPAATVSSVTAGREPMTSPPASSMYGQPPYQTDQYGRPIQPPVSQPQGYAQPASRDNYTRERPPPSAGDSRDARRRRH